MPEIEKRVDFQVQLQARDLSWDPIVVVKGNDYRPGEHWYDNAGDAGKDAQRVRERYAWAKVRVVRRTTRIETTEL